MMPAPGHEIDPTARISALADLEHSTRGSRLVIGAGSVVDAFVKIKFAGGSGDVEIGEKCYLNSGTVIYSGHGVHLGRDVLVAANCTFAATNHAVDQRDVPIRLQGFMPGRGGIKVGDDVWIGANTVLLDGTAIGTGAVIAAGTLVKGMIPAHAIIAGNPWRVVRMRGDAR